MSDIKSEKKTHATEDRAKVQDKIHAWVLKEGAKSGLIWFTGVALLSLGLHRGYGPTKLTSNYNRIRPAYKTLIPILFGTGAFFTRTDIAAMEADRAFALQYAVNKDEILAQQQEELAAYDKPFEITQEGISNYLWENRFAIVGGIWATTVIATLAYNFGRKDLKLSQKLINARMTSQAAALAGMVAFGAAASMNTKAKPLHEDEHFQEILKSKSH